MQPMEIYVAEVPLDGRKGSKFRPALVIKVDRNNIFVFKVTTKYASKSTRIKNLYYPLKNWREAGLNKQSYVDAHKLYRLDREIMFRKRPIGKLTTLDRIGLYKFIRSKQK